MKLSVQNCSFSFHSFFEYQAGIKYSMKYFCILSHDRCGSQPFHIYSYPAAERNKTSDKERIGIKPPIRSYFPIQRTSYTGQD